MIQLIYICYTIINIFYKKKYWIHRYLIQKLWVEFIQKGIYKQIYDSTFSPVY